MTDDASSEDLRWMQVALDEGRKGDPSPNPHVGCVLVKHGQQLAAAHHSQIGAAHAEQVALEEAGSEANGATLYITLEPCNHHGRTPPCVDAIIAAKVARVVVGSRDPNPHLEGGGLDKLRAAGVKVDEGVLQDQTDALLRPWRHYITQGSSYLAIKLACSLDGRIAAKTGASQWITSDASRALTHRLRAQHDAIMVGVSTVIADDPRLTVREGSPEVDPIRIVVDSKLRIPISSNVVQTAAEVSTCVITTESAPEKAEAALVERQVNVVRVQATAQGRCDMRAALSALAQREVVSVLCEGGAELSGSLLAEQLACDLHIFIAPLLLGPRGRPCAVDWAGPDDPETAPQIAPPTWQWVGPDAYLQGPIRYPRRTQ